VISLGGGTLARGRGIAPQWARLGYVEFVAADLGQATFELSPGAMQFGRFGVGNVAWDLVDLGTPIVVDQIGGTRINMTIVHEPSSIGDNGEVASLPASAGWVHEWQSFWVEIWVSTPETTTLAVAGATVDLQYDSGYTTAQQIEYGPAFTLDRTGTIDDRSGLVSAIGGRTALTNVGDDAYVLLARVRFASTGNDQVAVDQAARNIGPYDMQMVLASGQTEVVGAGAVVPVLGDTPATELWAVVYDIDDNNQVDFGDLAMFAPAFGRTVAAPDAEPPYVWWADFDKTGLVDFGDLAFFAPNFGKTRSAVQAGTQTLVFPTNFPDAWRAVPAAPGGEGEAMFGGAAQEQPATGLANRRPAAADAMFAQLGVAEEERTPPWLRPRAATAGHGSDRIEAPQQSESPVLLYSRSSSSVASPAERVHRWTEHWEPLEDLLSLLAAQPPDRLLNPQDALFAQAGKRFQ
jgi:alkaline phosphatase